jgi:O-antigen ligase
MIFDFYLNTSLIFLLLLLLKRKKIVPIFIKIPFFLCGLVIYGALFISEGRSGFIAANILIFGMIVYKIWEWRKIAGILVGLCTPFILFSIISHHPRMQNDMVKDEPRLVVWKVSEKIIAEKPYMGYGPSDAQDILMKRSMQDETILNNAYFGSFIKEGGIVNPHNQFLQTSMEFGILGVIVLLFIFLYPIVAIEKGRRIFMFFFIFITLNQAFFDVFGCAFSALTFTFVVVLLLRAHSIEKQQLIS